MFAVAQRGVEHTYVVLGWTLHYLLTHGSISDVVPTGTVKLTRLLPQANEAYGSVRSGCRAGLAERRCTTGGSRWCSPAGGAGAAPPPPGRGPPPPHPPPPPGGGARRAPPHDVEPEVDAGLEEEPEAKDTKVDEIAAKKAATKAAKEARQEELKAQREKKKAQREEKIAAKKAAKKARQEELKAERERKKAEREEKIAAKKAVEEHKEAKIEEESKASGYKQVQGGATSGEMPARAPRETPSLQDLMFYARSRSASVRLRAVKDLISVSDDRARQVLEERMRKDTNMQVRFTAIRGLSARRSFASIPAIREARITAATSQERAVLKKAMDEIIEGGR